MRIVDAEIKQVKGIPTAELTLTLPCVACTSPP